MRERAPERVIAVEWGRGQEPGALFPIDVVVEAGDRPGLLRDISEVLSQGEDQRHRRQHAERQGQRRRGGVDDLHRRGRLAPSGLAKVLAQVAQIAGVRSARRK